MVEKRKKALVWETVLVTFLMVLAVLLCSVAGAEGNAPDAEEKNVGALRIGTGTESENTLPNAVGTKNEVLETSEIVLAATDPEVMLKEEADLTLPGIERAYEAYTESLEPVITAPQSITVGQDITVKISPVQGAIMYYINLNEMSDDRIYFYPTETAGTYVISGLIANVGTYNLLVRADDADGNFGITEKTITVTDPNNQRINKLISFYTPKYEFQMNETVSFELELAGATQFAIRTGSQTEYKNEYGYTNTWTDLPGDYQFFDADSTGKLRYEYTVSELDSFCIEARALYQGKWTVPTRAVYTVEEPLVLSAPAVSFPLYIYAGAELPVTISRNSHEKGYWVMVDNDDEKTMFFEENEFVISDELLDTSGTHEIYIEAYTDDLGYQRWSNGYTGTVTVTGSRPAAPSLTSDKSSYLISDTMIFTAELAGATKIRFNEQFLVDGVWTDLSINEALEKDAKDGKATTTFLWTHPDNTTKLRCYARALKNGIWSAAAVREVTIQADPNWQGSDLILPEDLTEIEEEAFAGIDARVIVITGNVSKIDHRAFAGSKKLWWVYFSPAVVSIADDAFDGCNLVTFIVERDSEGEAFVLRNGMKLGTDYYYNE